MDDTATKIAELYATLQGEALAEDRLRRLGKSVETRSLLLRYRIGRLAHEYKMGSNSLRNLAAATGINARDLSAMVHLAQLPKVQIVAWAKAGTVWRDLRRDYRRWPTPESFHDLDVE
ncbi:MAG: hypothetical protein AMXMBFR7_50990 [Planctomycetota bacterium]